MAGWGVAPDDRMSKASREATELSGAQSHLRPVNVEDDAALQDDEHFIARGVGVHAYVAPALGVVPVERLKPLREEGVGTGRC